MSRSKWAWLFPQFLLILFRESDLNPKLSIFSYGLEDYEEFLEVMLIWSRFLRLIFWENSETAWWFLKGPCRCGRSCRVSSITDWYGNVFWYLSQQFELNWASTIIGIKMCLNRQAIDNFNCGRWFLLHLRWHWFTFNSGWVKFNFILLIYDPTF